VLEILADAEKLAGGAELLLHGLPGGDLVLGAVGAEQVPGIEAGKVLEGAKDLIATSDGRGVLEEMGHRRMVDEGVGDHDVGLGVAVCGDGLVVVGVVAERRGVAMMLEVRWLRRK